jgi:hypothetical protein
MEEGARALPDSAGIRYGLALVAAAEGREDDARRELREAISRDPRLREEVERDAELGALMRGPCPRRG